MRTILMAGVLLLATAACDRRDDPEVDPASTGVSSPAGDVVDSTADPAATPPTMPPPAVPADCERDLAHRIKALIGVTATIRAVKPGEVERSAGKARRVVDLRGKD